MNAFFILLGTLFPLAILFAYIIIPYTVVSYLIHREDGQPLDLSSLFPRLSFVITIHHRYHLGCHFAHTRQRVLVLGSHKFGWNHYFKHNLPVGHFVKIFVPSLDRAVPAVIERFDKSSQHYFVDIGGRKCWMEASLVCGNALKPGWLGDE